jgi:hypothetical protein
MANVSTVIQLLINGQPYEQPSFLASQEPATVGYAVGLLTRAAKNAFLTFDHSGWSVYVSPPIDTPKDKKLFARGLWKAYMEYAQRPHANATWQNIVNQLFLMAINKSPKIAQLARNRIPIDEDERQAITNMAIQLSTAEQRLSRHISDHHNNMVRDADRRAAIDQQHRQAMTQLQENLNALEATREATETERGRRDLAVTMSVLQKVAEKTQRMIRVAHLGLEEGIKSLSSAIERTRFVQADHPDLPRMQSELGEIKSKLVNLEIIGRQQMPLEDLGTRLATLSSKMDASGRQLQSMNARLRSMEELTRLNRKRAMAPNSGFSAASEEVQRPVFALFSTGTQTTPEEAVEYVLNDTYMHAEAQNETIRNLREEAVQKQMEINRLAHELAQAQSHIIALQHIVPMEEEVKEQVDMRDEIISQLQFKIEDQKETIRDLRDATEEILKTAEDGVALAHQEAQIELSLALEETMKFIEGAGLASQQSQQVATTEAKVEQMINSSPVPQEERDIIIELQEQSKRIKLEALEQIEMNKAHADAIYNEDRRQAEAEARSAAALLESTNTEAVALEPGQVAPPPPPILAEELYSEHQASMAASSDQMLVDNVFREAEQANTFSLQGNKLPNGLRNALRAPTRTANEKASLLRHFQQAVGNNMGSRAARRNASTKTLSRLGIYKPLKTTFIKDEFVNKADIVAQVEHHIKQEAVGEIEDIGPSITRAPDHPLPEVKAEPEDEPEDEPPPLEPQVTPPSSPTRPAAPPIPAPPTTGQRFRMTPNGPMTEEEYQKLQASIGTAANPIDVSDMSDDDSLFGVGVGGAVRKTSRRIIKYCHPEDALIRLRRMIRHLNYLRSQHWQYNKMRPAVLPPAATVEPQGEVNVSNDVLQTEDENMPPEGFVKEMTANDAAVESVQVGGCAPSDSNCALYGGADGDDDETDIGSSDRFKQMLMKAVGVTPTSIGQRTVGESSLPAEIFQLENLPITIMYNGNYLSTYTPQRLFPIFPPRPYRIKSIEATSKIPQVPRVRQKLLAMQPPVQPEEGHMGPLK